MAQGKGKQQATAAGSVSVPAIFVVHVVAQISSILLEPFRAPRSEADTADLHVAANKPHFETVLRHPSRVRIRWKRLGEDKLKFSVDQVSPDRGIHTRNSFGSSDILCGQLVIERRICSISPEYREIHCKAYLTFPISSNVFAVPEPRSGCAKGRMARSRARTCYVLCQPGGGGGLATDGKAALSLKQNFR